MKRTFPLSFVLILIFSASSAFPQQPQLTQKDGKSKLATAPIIGNCAYAVDPSKNPNDLQDITQPFPARGGSVDWGLALSGGGIRSASFNIGAMKALYDLGFLDRIDVISSVSGGGYASYWVFTNYNSHKTQKFGEDTFRDDVFLQNVCNLPARTFFPLKSMLKAIFQTKNGAFNSYETAIRDTFGNGKPEATKINDIRGTIEEAKVPYFIINTTLGSNEKNALCKVFELTPTHMGNPTVGFYKWIQNDDNVLRWSESVAMASAGIKWKLGRPIPNYASNIKALTNSHLSDGGHSENLAAFSLIRRGVKKIIIIDAGHDPNYEFIDYKNLRDHLGEMGVDFRVKNIEDFLDNRRKKDVFAKSSVSEGYARSRPDSDTKTPIRSDIYYVKMSKPESIITKKLEDTAAYNSGKVYSDNRRKALKTSGWDCDDPSVVKFGFRSDMYVYTVTDYSDYLNKHKFWKRVGKIFPFFRYNFPHTTTMEQKFHRDQLDAFVGLGYLQAVELEKHRDW